MLTVHCSPPGENLISTPDFHAKLNLVNSVAGTNLLSQAQRHIERGGSTVKHQVNIFAKGRFSRITHGLFGEFGLLVLW
jgi:hypothetical protein